MTEEKKEHAPDGRSSTQWLSPEEQKLYDDNTKPILDLSLVHQKAIPGLWNQVRFNTFPCNWMVIGHLPGDARDKMVLQGEGPGGVKDAARYLRDDEVQYAGFRVSITLNAEIIQDDVFDAPEDIFVLLRWVGKHTTAQQRANVDEEMDFMKTYFHSHHIDIALLDHEVNTSDITERVTSLTSHLKQFVMSHVVTKADSSTQARACQFDFDNASHVSMCTHYDTLESFETAEGQNSAMTHDALFNAMSEMQKVGDEEVPYYQEAKERYDDIFAEAKDGATTNATMSSTEPTQAAMEGEQLQYDYNTFDLDHGDEIVGLPPTAVATISTTITAEEEYEEPPPAPSTATSVPSGMNGTRQVPLDETDMLIMERLKVEEESLILRRQLAAIQQERDRQSSKQRIQERLKARRAQRQQQQERQPLLQPQADLQSEQPPQQQTENEFQKQIQERAATSRMRTAQRVATRMRTAQRVATDTSTTKQNDIANTLAHRQRVMTERLREVEARIESNNTDLAKN